MRSSRESETVSIPGWGLAGLREVWKVLWGIEEGLAGGDQWRDGQSLLRTAAVRDLFLDLVQTSFSSGILVSGAGDGKGTLLG